MSQLRPLSARALKSVIDTLRPYLTDARVLDLYAGQGRFGIECLKEEAQSVLFIEKNGKTASEIKAEIQKKKFTDRAKVITADIFSIKPNETFDIIFADPPFPEWTEPFQRKLENHIQPLLSPDGIWIVKYPMRAENWEPTNFKPWKDTTFGESRLLYFQAK